MCFACQESCTNILSCSEYRTFWVSWNSGLIAVGKGPDVYWNEVVQWRDANPKRIQVPDCYFFCMYCIVNGWRLVDWGSCHQGQDNRAFTDGSLSPIIVLCEALSFRQDYSVVKMVVLLYPEMTFNRTFMSAFQQVFFDTADSELGDFELLTHDGRFTDHIVLFYASM